MHLSKNEYKIGAHFPLRSLQINHLPRQCQRVSPSHISGPPGHSRLLHGAAGSQQGRKGCANPSGCALGQRPFSATHPQQLTHGNPAPHGSTSVPTGPCWLEVLVRTAGELCAEAAVGLWAEATGCLCVGRAARLSPVTF